jgi:hypothetical protein
MASPVERLSVDDLDAHDLPGRQTRGINMLIPQMKGQAHGCLGVVGLIPVPHLCAVVRESTSEQERVLLTESLEGSLDGVRRNTITGHGQGDVPHHRLRRVRQG